MSIVNINLYKKAKNIADQIYEKPSAYKSMFIVKKYVELGGTYTDNNKPTNGLNQWINEKWIDIGDKDYPVYRPTVRINKNTPLLPSEIDSKNLVEQINLKQIIRGDSNLPKFIPKTKEEELHNYSNFNTVYKNAKKYFKNIDFNIDISTHKNKKFMIHSKESNKWIHFGQFGYEDFTKHLDDSRRKLYIKRASKIKGNWENDPYSPNNLSLHILWGWTGNK
jgi:hypothetical protein